MSLRKWVLACTLPCLPVSANVADRVQSRLNRSGGIVRIYKKWFGSFGEKPPAMLNALCTS
ncbi:MAG: hypothetical protein GY815_18485 [Gammaproteobacteria bacterium]|nr:hypothetical protein [Gammaproteobacteria bacterium]